MVTSKADVPPRKAAVHIFAVSVIMLSHSVNITLPWTLGVFMVRDFMHLNGESANSTGESALARNHSSLGLPDATPAGNPSMHNSSDSNQGLAEQELSLQQVAEKDKQEHLVGFRAGILSAAFSSSQVLTALFWGHLANRGGTKPLIQISQLSAVVCNLALGLAPNYGMALGVRFASGLFNSITGAMKTNVARAFDVKHQPRVFGLSMSCWALGSILGPCFGGLMAEPCTTWDVFRTSDLCSDSGLLRKFPFLIPFAATALLSAVSYVVALFALHREDAVRAAWPSEDEQQTSLGCGGGEAQSPDATSVQDNDAETASLLHSHPGDGASDRKHGAALSLDGASGQLGDKLGSLPSEDSIQLSVIGSSEIPLLTETEASNSGKCETVVKNGDDSTVRNAEEEQPTGQDSAGSDEDAPVSVLWWKDRDVKARIFGYGVLAVLFSFIGESIPIFSAMSLRNRGLAFSSTDFAIPSGVGGLWLMISATCVYPRVSKALGNKRTVIAGLSIMVFVTAGYPCTSFVADNKVASLFVFCALYSLQSLAVNFCFASGNVMVNEAGLKPHVKDQIGSINGAGHMIASSVRAIGPAFAGVLWSLVTASRLAVGIFIPFLLCTVCALLEIKVYDLM